MSPLFGNCSTDFEKIDSVGKHDSKVIYFVLCNSLDSLPLVSEIGPSIYASQKWLISIFLKITSDGIFKIYTQVGLWEYPDHKMTSSAISSRL